MHHIARRNDSGQRCPRGKLFQVCCADGRCPDCTADYLTVDQFQGADLGATVAQNVICQIPSIEEEFNLVSNYGHAEFCQIDKSRFGNRKSEFYSRNIIFKLFYFIVVDRHGRPLTTRLVYGPNYGESVQGRRQPNRKFLEVFVTHNLCSCFLFKRVN